jgi:regulatory protein
MWRKVSLYSVELEQLVMESGRITAIERKGRGRYSVFLDGCFAFSVSDESIVKFGLCVHAVLDCATQSKLINLEQEEQALTCALRVLSYRPRSNNEIDQKLRSKGFSSKIRESVLGKLIDVGYLDDVRFAESWINYLP